MCAVFQKRIMFPAELVDGIEHRKAIQKLAFLRITCWRCHPEFSPTTVLLLSAAHRLQEPSNDVQDCSISHFASDSVCMASHLSLGKKERKLLSINMHGAASLSLRSLKV